MTCSRELREDPACQHRPNLGHHRFNSPVFVQFISKPNENVGEFERMCRPCYEGISPRFPSSSLRLRHQESNLVLQRSRARGPVGSNFHQRLFHQNIFEANPSQQCVQEMSTTRWVAPRLHSHFARDLNQRGGTQHFTTADDSNSQLLSSHIHGAPPGKGSRASERDDPGRVERLRVQPRVTFGFRVPPTNPELPRVGGVHGAKQIPSSGDGEDNRNSSVIQVGLPSTSRLNQI